MEFTGERPLLREEHGFRRTVFGCASCTAPCRHVPGGLDPSDLSRLCPAGRELFSWAEEHLRALTNAPYPILVPARQVNGHCHWLFNGQCAVHEHAPYGCAFFDSHMSDAEIEQRYQATIRARQEDARMGGIYYQVWFHLCQRGLIGTPGNRSAVVEEILRMHGNSGPLIPLNQGPASTVADHDQ